MKHSSYLFDLFLFLQVNALYKTVSISIPYQFKQKSSEEKTSDTWSTVTNFKMSPPKYVIGLDIGTTTARSFVYNVTNS